MFSMFTLASRSQTVFGFVLRLSINSLGTKPTTSGSENNFYLVLVQRF